MRAKRAGVEQVGAVFGDAAQRLGIGAGEEACAGLDWFAAGQIELGYLGVQRHVGGAVIDALVEIAGHAEAARGVADCRFHDVGQRERAEARQRLAPSLQIAGRRDRCRTQGILAADHVHCAGGGLRVWCIGRRSSGERRHALVVDHHVAAIGEADMRHAAAEHADHHRLDHGEREECRDRRVDRIATGGQHFHTGRRGERMVGDNHATGGGRRLLLATECGAGVRAPIGLGHRWSLHAIIDAEPCADGSGATIWSVSGWIPS